MEKFERIKRAFDGKVEHSWHFDFHFNVPGTDPTFSKQRRVFLQSQDLRGLFEPVLETIFTLILSQITAANEQFRP